MFELYPIYLTHHDMHSCTFFTLLHRAFTWPQSGALRRTICSSLTASPSLSLTHFYSLSSQFFPPSHFLGIIFSHISGLFRDLNPLFVLIFTILTTYVFKVASSEEEGGRRLAYMISDTFLNDVTGVYLSGKPGSKDFSPISSSEEASSQINGKRIWELTEKIIKNNM